MIHTGTENELKQFIHTTNELHPTFKFTFETSQQELTFLDVEVFKGQKYNHNGILDLRTHTKPTDTFQYLHRKSWHPTATFKGFIEGEMLRYCRKCNNENDFNKKVSLFTGKLIERKYTQTKYHICRSRNNA